MAGMEKRLSLSPPAQSALVIVTEIAPKKARHLSLKITNNEHKPDFCGKVLSVFG